MCMGKQGDPFCKTGGAGWVGSLNPEMNMGGTPSLLRA